MPVPTVASIMSRDPETISPDEVLLDIRNMLRQRGFRHLLVVEGERVVGVISDRDVLRRLSPFLDTPAEESRDVQTLVQRAGDLMTPSPVMVQEDTPFDEAVRLVLDHRISCLPVVDVQDRLVGIVTTRDLLEHSVRQMELSDDPPKG